MDIVVLGAGIVGVTTAYCLARDGHSVTVVDRQKAAGLETSFANGSQLVAYGGAPWSAPGVPSNLIKWFGREDAPMLLRLSAIPGLWRWGPQFLRNCTPKRWAENATSLHHLAMSSIRELDRILGDEDIAFDELREGILFVHAGAEGFRGAVDHLATESAVGLRKRAVSADECVAIEPGLAPLRGRIAGGIYSEADRTGDCLSFTQGLAAAAARLGVTFLHECAVTGITVSNGKVASIETTTGTLTAERYVLSLGSFSAPLARQAGFYLPIYPVKGYSATVSTAGWDHAPSVSLIDSTRKMGYSRLGDRLRVAGTAELDGYSAAPNPRRGEMLLDGLMEMFPDFPNRDKPVQHWTGLRPMTPDGVPLVGTTKLDNLLVNSGHGTLGWSLSAGSARLISDLIGGRTPAVDPAPYAVHRRH